MPSGLVAQLVEQSPEKACVAGSIPAQTTIFITIMSFLFKNKIKLIYIEIVSFLFLLIFKKPKILFQKKKT